MLGILTMAGNALRAFGSVHPAIKWGIVAIVGLLAVEVVGKEGVNLYMQLATVRSTVNATNATNAGVTAIIAPLPSLEESACAPDNPPRSSSTCTESPARE